MRDSDPAVRIQATVGAALLGDSGALGQLRSILHRPDLPPALRRDALLAEARAGQRAATLGLADYLARSDDVYERIEIIEALGELRDAAAAPALRGQLATLRTRLYAIEALGKVHARAALPDLVQALRRDTFISWRKAAARALGLIGDAAAVPALRDSVMRELESDVVGEGLAALVRLGGLPVPGARAVAARGWRCRGGVCTADLDVTCDRGAGHDLLLAADRDGPVAVRLLCGDRVAVASALGAAAAAVTLPGGLTGPLRVQSVGSRPTLRYVALRPTPTRPAVETEEKVEKSGAKKEEAEEEEEW
jgi:HEAT repeat protein